MKWLFNLLFRSRVEELKRIEEALNAKLEQQNTVYTTIRSFKGLNKQYYNWICELIAREEYAYMLFDLRENIIRQMSLSDDKEKAARYLGRLDMLNVIDNYLKQYKREYEDQIRRNSKNTEK